MIGTLLSFSNINQVALARRKASSTSRIVWSRGPCAGRTGCGPRWTRLQRIPAGWWRSGRPCGGWTCHASKEGGWWRNLTGCGRTGWPWQRKGYCSSWTSQRRTSFWMFYRNACDWVEFPRLSIYIRTCLSSHLTGSLLGPSTRSVCDLCFPHWWNPTKRNRRVQSAGSVSEIHAHWHGPSGDFTVHWARPPILIQYSAMWVLGRL